MVVLKILFISALFIISTNNLHLTQESDRAVFFDAYTDWFDDFFDNLKFLTAYVIRAHWLPVDQNISHNSTR